MIEAGKAVSGGNTMYGTITIKPERKYEKNITTDPEKDRLRATFDLCSNSLAELSESNEPTLMENASTKMRMIPVRSIVARGEPTAAIPDTNPTVETKLSSTPKVKFRIEVEVKNFKGVIWFACLNSTISRRRFPKS